MGPQSPKWVLAIDGGMFTISWTRRISLSLVEEILTLELGDFCWAAESRSFPGGTDGVVIMCGTTK